MRIRASVEADRAALLDVHRAAFDSDVEAELTHLLFDDPTAAPIISLLAEEAGVPVGHVLVTTARLEDGCNVTAAILAPLAVLPANQGSGVGGALVSAALEAAAEAGVELMFVLGHPGYYQRFGFRPAFPLGLSAPRPIPAEAADAWMVTELHPGALARAHGTVQVSEVLGREEYWVE